MGRYAETTSVSADRSRAEVERVLQRYGADAFTYGWQGRHAAVAFRADGRMVKFTLEMPDPEDRRFTHTPSRGTRRSESQAHAAWEQATRQRWRALALVVKAKLEAVESGITTFEQEFLAHLLLPNGATVYEETREKIALAYESGHMPALLPGSVA